MYSLFNSQTTSKRLVNGTLGLFLDILIGFFILAQGSLFLFMISYYLFPGEGDNPSSLPASLAWLLALFPATAFLLIDGFWILVISWRKNMSTGTRIALRIIGLSLLLATIAIATYLYGLS